MMVFDVRGDVSQITRHLSRLAQEQIPYATARALTKTAQFVKSKMPAEMQSAFDRPTPYTLGATFVQPATKQRLFAVVKIRDEQTKGRAPIKYLSTEIYGGSRGQKGFELRLQDAGVMPRGWFAVPSRYLTLDRYGNVPRGLIVRILSQLQAMRDPYQNETPALRRKRNAKARLGRYFAVMPGMKRTAHLQPGIYERVGTGFGSAIRPVFVYVQRAKYRPRLKFFERADQISRMRFPIEFALAATEAIRSAR